LKFTEKNWMSKTGPTQLSQALEAKDSKMQKTHLPISAAINQ
jgi:hypothetical protein